MSGSSSGGSTTASQATVLVPLKLNAFALTPGTCANTNKYSIAPIAQPNYTFLRLHDNLIVPDILDHVDLHQVSPANLNPRLTDLGTGQTRQNRLGVYIHWTLPPLYRSGSAAAPTASGTADLAQADRKLRQGFPASSAAAPSFGAATDYSTPDFRPVPNRWLVIRHINAASIAPAGTKIPEFQSWVIESDRLRNINDDDLTGADLEVDVSPSTNPVLLDPSSGTVVEGQAEAFIGQCTPAASWSESAASAGSHIDLTVMTSSNPLFADYQPHNSNVFSFVDNFSYTTASGSTGYLTKAICDYQVIGWHSSSDHDPFTTDPRVSSPPQANRLQDCQLALKNGDSASAIAWLNSNAATRVLCHATMYDVAYDVGSVPPTVLANTAGQLLQQSQSIAVGVTPLDTCIPAAPILFLCLPTPEEQHIVNLAYLDPQALIAYCRAHETTDATNLATLEQDLLRIQTLLLSGESDDVDALQAAADESFEQAFTRSDGGTVWHFHQESDPSSVPSTDQVTAIRTLNQNQKVFDSAARETASKRWELFAQWWLWGEAYHIVLMGVQMINSNGDSVRIRSKPEYCDVPVEWRQMELANNINSAKSSLSNLATNQQPQQGTDDRFYQRKDPTVLFGNIQAGFESDFNTATKVRLQDQVVTPPAGALVTGWATLPTTLTSIIPKLPVSLQSSAQALAMEFYQLRTSNNVTSATLPQVLPWFHDEAARSESRGRDRWQGTQPWMPLFIEYEAVYYHIPFSKWKLKEAPMLSNWGASVLHYGFNDDVSKSSTVDDRTISGRVILEPQAAATLSNTLTQILQNTNEGDLENLYGMPKSEQASLLANISQIEFASSGMYNLTSDLLTLQQGGQHVKPTIRLTNSSPIAVQAATTAASAIGFTTTLMQAMDTQTTMTPYGDSVAMDTDAPPMKLVTHGQLMFTKLNVIDKFGQAISAISPAPLPYGALVPTISPCLSDTYFPGTIGNVDPASATARANCIISQGNNKSCPFINLPPGINQPARLNAKFVSNVNGSWTTTSEWENPIWGWLVVNFAEQGLQVFLADGTFYREVRFGGSAGIQTTARWLPYDPPKNLPNTSQLDFLIQQLSGLPYLSAFVDMILQSTASNQTAAPDSYATFSSAIIGKPLALVNIGYSLELAGPENKNWSTVNSQGPDLHLLQPDETPFPPGASGGYSFPVKLGDADRTFDGLIGYFNSALATQGGAASAPTPAGQSDLNLSSIYTYYPSTNIPAPAGDPRVLISSTAQNFPLFTPYYLPAGKAGDPIQDQAKNMQVFGAIMDPFLPIHAYSAILPNKALKLPAYTVQEALKNINAFWRIGPLLVAADVPAAYDPARAMDSNSVGVVASSSSSTQTADPTATKPKIALPLPPPAAAADGADAIYRYLQPYVVPTIDPTTGANLGDRTEYNVFGISGDAAAKGDAVQARLADGPYTAVEGYAQIVRRTATAAAAISS
ncbi:MAG: hypothetical protein Q9191_000242 [Dirinaria sp. TL-2023a]